MSFIMENTALSTDKKSHNFFKWLAVALGALLILALLAYYLLVFSGIPGLTYWRDIWIETAMTTMKHQWLATAFIPRHIIDDVMARQSKNSEIIGGAKNLPRTIRQAIKITADRVKRTQTTYSIRKV